MSHTLYFVNDERTIPIYVSDISSSRSPVIAEHQILDAKHTTYQYLGSRSTEKTLGFTINSASDLLYLDTYVMLGVQFTYTDDKSTTGSYVCVGEFSYKRLQALNYTAPWYECRLPMANLVSSGSLYYQM